MYLNQVFVGNKDKNTEVKNWFMEPFKANFVRIRPKKWKGLMCMRFELFGCVVAKHRMYIFIFLCLFLLIALFFYVCLNYSSLGLNTFFILFNS